ncbi:PREDICTED: uncharacterized protein LOC104742084 isoform X1 [Camelina sativa]|uniref:Uncharacterized protein LOC104742084 isoform X1 n=1 Tax=Camelina sativa TaxID=90675 RepID=A0ABM0VUN2_CAMSA|nr:PREDICTED: uncharacterized protein LOC104742084 isoform X1 [Camelina sativa]
MDQAGEAAVLYRVFIGLRSTPVVKPIATLELFDPVAGRILRRLVWLCVGLDRRRTTRLLSFRNWISLDNPLISELCISAYVLGLKTDRILVVSHLYHDHKTA